MAVWLQTEDGKIKEYKTAYGVDFRFVGEYNDYDKWVTKCGKEWRIKPNPQDQCDHLECAIHVAESSAATKKNVPHTAAWEAILLAIILMIFQVMKQYEIRLETNIFFTHFVEPIIVLLFIFLITLFLASILTYFLEYGAEGRLDELNEFRINGTIKGIKASQIEAKAKHWWQFRR